MSHGTSSLRGAAQNLRHSEESDKSMSSGVLQRGPSLDASSKIGIVRHLRRLGLVVALLIVSGASSGAALAADASSGDRASQIPDLRLSVSETPGETTVRLPLALEGYRLYGLLSPYLSLGSTTALGVPWSASLLPGLQRNTDGLDDVRLGAGMALPLSGRAQLYGEYRFLRGRIDAGTGRGLLQREPDSSDFRAGFSIRLD
jgi:hypothetical protein